jgi:hypothetical protein
MWLSLLESGFPWSIAKDVPFHPWSSAKIKITLALWGRSKPSEEGSPQPTKMDKQQSQTANVKVHGLDPRGEE